MALIEPVQFCRATSDLYGLSYLDDKIWVADATGDVDQITAVEFLRFAEIDYRVSAIVDEIKAISSREVFIIKNDTETGNLAFHLEDRVSNMSNGESRQQQSVKFQGTWTKTFRDDVAEFLKWNRESSTGDKNLGAASIELCLEFLDRGLEEGDRPAFVNIIGLLADFSISSDGWSLDGDFRG